MAIEAGQKMPEAMLVTMGPDGPMQVSLSERLKGRKVVIYGMPGAFTPGCHASHMPSVVRTAAAIRAKGVDEVMVITVNDAFVLKAWGEASGAAAAGITLLGDAEGGLIRALGIGFNAPVSGLYGRSSRFAAIVEDGVITLAVMDKPGQCDVSTGEAILARL
jgi:peroxiredoxin